MSCQFTEPTHPIPTQLPIVTQKNVAGAHSQDSDEESRASPLGGS